MALLTVRLRAGAIDPLRVRLAARLGHPAACQALGLDPLPPFAPGGASEAVVGDVIDDLLFRMDRATSVRAAAAALGAALPRGAPPASGPSRPTDLESIEALAAAEAWLACPCEEHARRARAVAARSPARPRSIMGELTFGDDPPDLSAEACVSRAAFMTAAAAGGAEQFRADAVSAALYAARAAGSAPVLAAVRRALLAWALSAG